MAKDPPYLSAAKSLGLNYCTCNNPFDTEFQSMFIQSYSPTLAPTLLVRIVCKNCNRATPYCESVSEAVRLWNDLHREEAANG